MKKMYDKNKLDNLYASKEFKLVTSGEWDEEQSKFVLDDDTGVNGLLLIIIQSGSTRENFTNILYLADGWNEECRLYRSEEAQDYFSICVNESNKFRINLENNTEEEYNTIYIFKAGELEVYPD